MKHKLNIGCGHNKFEGKEWINLDCSPHCKPDLLFDLSLCQRGDRLPLNDNSCSEMLMSHVLEHLSSPLPVLEELYRIAAPACQLTIHVPYGSSDSAFEDPTHVRQYFANSFLYFGQPAYAKADYGYRGDWRVARRLLVISPKVDKEALPENPADFMTMVNTYRNLIDEFIVVLEAVKPSRVPSDENVQAPIEFMFRGALHG